MAAKKRAARKIARPKKTQGPQGDSLQDVVPAHMPRGLGKVAQRQWRMLTALEKHLGVVMHACKEANVPRRTHYHWMENDAEYRSKVEDIEENAFDFVEHKLFESVQDKNIAAIIFFAKTRMKRRGYIERHEFTGADGGPVHSRVDMTTLNQELPPEEVLQVMKMALAEDDEVQNAIRRLHKQQQDQDG